MQPMYSSPNITLQQLSCVLDFISTASVSGEQFGAFVDVPWICCWLCQCCFKCLEC